VLCVHCRHNDHRCAKSLRECFSVISTADVSISCFVKGRSNFNTYTIHFFGMQDISLVHRFMMLLQTLVLLSFLLLPFASAEQQCYSLDGTIPDPGIKPCYADAAVSHCCGVGKDSIYARILVCIQASTLHRY
jgi:hypothetical protein